MNSTIIPARATTGAPLFPQRVVNCVCSPVAAKRYLRATRPACFNKLSPTTVHMLGLQGGPMNTDQFSAFARNSHREDMIRVRVHDEAGKHADMPTPPFVHYAPMVQRVVDAYCTPVALS